MLTSLMCEVGYNITSTQGYRKRFRIFLCLPPFLCVQIVHSNRGLYEFLPKNLLNFYQFPSNNRQINSLHLLC